MRERQIVGKILKEHFRNGKIKVSDDIIEKQRGIVREVLEKYNWMVDEIIYLSKIVISKEKYEEKLARVIEVWKEIESFLPVLSEDEIVEIVKINVGFVDFRKCADVAKALHSRNRPMRFTEIKEEVKLAESFRLKDASINKSLSRALTYLAESCLVLKCGRRKPQGGLVDTYYFRLFRFEDEKRECRECWIYRRIKEIVEKIERGEVIEQIPINLLIF